MADQKISELQLVVATGITPTGVYMPLYTPMMSPQNRRMSVPELFKSPPRLEVKDTSVAGNGEIATLTTSYGTASLRVGTGGQFIVGGDVAAVGSVSIVSDSSPLTLGAVSDVKLYRDASGVVALRAGLNNPQGIRVYNSYNGTNDEYLQVRFSGNVAQIGSDRNGSGTVRNLILQASGLNRLTVPAASGTAITLASSNTSTGDVLTLSSSLGTANLRVGSANQLVVAGDLSAVGQVAIISDSSPLQMGVLGDLSLYRDASGVLALRAGANNPQGIRVYNSYTGSNNDYLQLRFNSNTAQLGSERAGAGTVRNLDLQASGITRISIPAASGSAVTISSVNLSTGAVLDLTSPSGTASLRVGNGGQLVVASNLAAVGQISVISDNFPLTLGLNSDVGILRSASGIARIVDATATNHAALEAKRLVAVNLSGVTGNSFPVISGFQTWNDNSVTFTAVGINITDTGSNALSKALDVQVNGTGVLSVQKNGTVSSNYFVTAAAASAGLYARSNTGLVSFGVSDDVIITRDGAADTIAQRRGTNAQNFRIYNHYVSAGVNEYVGLGFTNSVASLSTFNSGSGIVRALNIGASGIPRITIPASHNSAVSVSGSLNVSGTFTGVTSPGLAVTQTWNQPTTDFNAVTIDIIPQNAGSSSNFIEFRSSGTSYAKLTQFGDFQASSFTPADLRTRIGSSGIKIGTTAQYTFVDNTSAASSAIAAGLALGGSGVVRATNGFGEVGSFLGRNFHATVFTITDGTGVDINPASGAIQTWTLGASRTPTANNFQSGQSVTLLIDDGASAYTVNWNTIGVSWLNSIVPALPTSGYGAVELFKVGSTVYGSAVGSFV